MSIWVLLAAVALAGSVGGVINALLTEKGFKKPGWETVGTSRIWTPGWITNVVIGSAASIVSWGLYGPYANNVLVGKETATSSQAFVLTLSSVVGAFLIGIGGSRFLTSQVEKSVLTTTATVSAAAAGASPSATAEIAVGNAVDALKTAQGL